MSYQELAKQYQKEKKEIAALLSNYHKYLAELKQAEPRERKEIYPKIETTKKTILNIFNKISERFTFHKSLSDYEAILIDRKIAKLLGLNDDWVL